MILGDFLGKLMLLDLRGKQIAQTWTAHQDVVSGVDFSENRIFSCSEDGRLKLWDVRKFSLVEENKTEGVLRKVVIFKDKIFTAGDSLRVWSDGLVASLPGRCKDFICKEGYLVAAREHQVVVWNIQTNITNEYI
jgi:WD40 repeat protein